MSATSAGSKTPPPSSGTRQRKDATQKEVTSSEKVRDKSTAKTYLEALSVLIPGERVDIPALSTALHHMAQSTSTKQTLQLGMRAVAILMAETAREEETQEVARKIAEQLVLPTDQIQSTVMEARALMKEIHKTAQEMKEAQATTLKSIAETLQAIGKTTTYASVTATHWQH
ncbi:hypothetical protein M422DRAFT_782968 [Sphaerobolus stellatus SS14]|uniref:Uncharacterized protein n=1 Tax=Sphaerobolus stellatus (strain SS14) TaxID=990650 RepID=A0A0C9V9G2_SPHS4|nr:hypothetical protein M422DRAFT_782968 [Sphaerobolus stellatus SS14]